MWASYELLAAFKLPVFTFPLAFWVTTSVHLARWNEIKVYRVRRPRRFYRVTASYSCWPEPFLNLDSIVSVSARVFASRVLSPFTHNLVIWKSHRFTKTATLWFYQPETAALMFLFPVAVRTYLLFSILFVYYYIIWEFHIGDILIF